MKFWSEAAMLTMKTINFPHQSIYQPRYLQLFAIKIAYYGSTSQGVDVSQLLKRMHIYRPAQFDESKPLFRFFCYICTEKSKLLSRTNRLWSTDTHTLLCWPACTESKRLYQRC